MPPIKESTQQTAGASAPLDLPTQSDEVDPGLVQVSATACISGVAAANTARCGWETQMENRMNATEQGMSAIEQRMSAAEQGMSATEQGRSATKERMSAAEQGLRAAEQRMSAAEQGISATKQRMSTAEQGISVTEQRMKATEQLGRETRRELGELGRETRRELGELGRETRRELGEIRELLQAALPNAANVTAATASCSQEATMATINTGIVGCLNVLPIEAQGIKFGVFTISLHVHVSEKISDNLVCTLKFDRVSTIAS